MWPSAPAAMPTPFASPVETVLVAPPGSIRVAPPGPAAQSAPSGPGASAVGAATFATGGALSRPTTLPTAYHSESGGPLASTVGRAPTSCQLSSPFVVMRPRPREPTNHSAPSAPGVIARG